MKPFRKPIRRGLGTRDWGTRGSGFFANVEVKLLWSLAGIRGMKRLRAGNRPSILIPITSMKIPASNRIAP
jgi:hypothetical protein